MATKAYFINSSEANYNDSEFAWFQSLILTEGVIGDAQTGSLGFLVSQNTTPDLSVNVSTGKALLEITKDDRTFKVVGENLGIENLIVNPNISGNSRVDTVIVRADNDTMPNILKDNIVTVEIVEGNSDTALSDEDIDTIMGEGVGWIRLAHIMVENNASEIENSDIADQRAKVFFSNGLSFSPLFINSSAGSADAGKVPTLNEDGKLDSSFFVVSNIPVMFSQQKTNTFGDSTSMFNITHQGGDTYRYTWNGTGTNPNIDATNAPIGDTLSIEGQNFNPNNNGGFVITGSGINYFEVLNPNGVPESNKTLGTGNIKYAWLKPLNLKYIEVSVTGGGSGGKSGTSNLKQAGNAGGTAIKIIAADSLPDIVPLTIGVGSVAGPNRLAGQSSSFLYVVGKGAAGAGNSNVSSLGDSGDVNIVGGRGSFSTGQGGFGGASIYGNYTALGSGGPSSDGGASNGVSGIIKIIEYYK